MSSPSGFGWSPTAKRFMVHFELKIVPLMTQYEQLTTYLCHNWNSDLALSVRITDKVIFGEILGVLPLQDTP